MIELRADQMEAVAKLREALTHHQSVMFQAATGFGKTVVGSYMALGAQNKRRRVVFGCHRKEIMLQTAKTFDRFGIRYGYIAAKMQPDPFAYVQIASADTLRSRRKWLDCDLFVPDEAHLWAANTRASMIEEAKANGALVVGLSATPARLDGRPLTPLFDHMVCGPSVEWLMDNGHLSRYRAFAPVRPDMAGLHSVGGDYVTSELDERFNRPSIIGDAIKVHRQYASGLRTMAFAFSRKHGKDLTAAYNAAGIGAVYIDGETSPADRRSRIVMFADGAAEVLVSVDLAIEGFDLSAQIGRDVPVEAVSLQRPTQSMPKAKQMVGRALRPKVRPAVIMDHVNLLAMHGLPDDDVEWSLEGRKKGPSKPGEAAIAVTTCASCFGVFRPAPSCPHCGMAVEVEGRKVEEVDGELDEVDVEALRRARKVEVARARDLPSLVAVARERGYKTGWVANIMIARGQRVDWRAIEMALRG